MIEFYLEYFMARFCEDFNKIRNYIFKKFTIKSASEKFGIYPIDSTQCIAQLRKFVPGTLQKKSRKSDLSLSTLASEPKLFCDVHIHSQTLHKMEVRLNK